MWRENEDFRHLDLNKLRCESVVFSFLFPPSHPSRGLSSFSPYRCDGWLSPHGVLRCPAGSPGYPAVLVGRPVRREVGRLVIKSGRDWENKRPGKHL
ncbi:hypothetical protein Pcinc_028903 [Petrolisthes cinctipes]|uniref:Uncharacterized protein n=1 Tax=Petrolisthes cinctipes TaxID=88211 RepID=A0AAE1K8A9_PETCI|nr:hypothetical protein Pcinc_028903 [Petrolisthes cinctipes]